ncbi:uncharacterized protein LOC135366697 isoform X2 [Ornithodoros turicata]|uniref:uncharacterized protein LOC135366697 isoform X2 n=1 Tax=Ornithodoros turicata TaxID=34597 RepID=UPI003139DFD6
MVNVCAIKTCPNRNVKNRPQKLRFHIIPTDEPYRSAWLRRIGRQADGENSTTHLRVCDLHFERAAYVDYGSREHTIKKARLRCGAVPTLHLPTIEPTKPSEPSEPSPKRLKRSLLPYLQQKTHSNDGASRQGPHSSPRRPVTSTELTQSPGLLVVKTTPLPTLQAKKKPSLPLLLPKLPALCPVPMPQATVRVVQVPHTPFPVLLSKASSADPEAEEKASPAASLVEDTTLCPDIAAQRTQGVPAMYDKQDTKTCTKSTQTDGLIGKRSVWTQNDCFVKLQRHQQVQTDACREPATSLQPPHHCSTEPLHRHYEDEDCDDEYILGDITSESERAEGRPRKHPDARHDRKFMVFESCLLQLFRACSTCSAVCDNTVSRCGTMITVRSACPNNHTRTWSSQPLVNGRAAGNILLAGAVLFSGLSPTAVLQMFRNINVQTMTTQLFYIYQRSFLLPAIERVWLQEQRAILDSVQGQEVHVSGAGRCDSPGVTAKFMTYTVHVEELNKILHSVQVHLDQSDEVLQSVSVQKEGLLRCLSFLKEQGIKAKSLTTDCHPSVQKYMEAHEPHIDHFFDVWHISKRLKKKLTAASKTRGCGALAKWVQGMSNHLYWCAIGGGGDSQLVLDMWQSMINHSADIHDGHGGRYPSCLHGEIEDGDWLDPKSPAHEKLKAIVRNPRLLSDLKKVSPTTRARALESFHGVLIRFAPESVSFSPEAMLARTQLAMLHWNENTDSCRAVAPSGHPRHKVKPTRSKRGHEVVCPMKTTPTYRYVQKLLEQVQKECLSWERPETVSGNRKRMCTSLMSSYFPR